MKETWRTILTAVCLILALSAPAANANEGESESLPIELTPEEMTRLHEIGINHKLTAPPPAGGIYNPSEWDPSEGVLIRYPLGISYLIVKEMAEDIMVYCVVSSSLKSQAITNFTAQGVNMSHVEWITANSDSYWIRDYGPWFIFDGVGNFGIVDHIYNRPRPNDDAVPGAVGTAWSIPVYGMNLEHTGGNYMSDGRGTAASTDLVYSENPGMTHHVVDSIIERFTGNDYIVMADPLGEYIEHIDCWGKFLTPQTVMVLELPPSHAQHDELDAAAAYFASLTGPWGRPYTVVRVYATGSQAYTNSIILNNKVFVPISGGAYDAAAIASYQAALPGYEILGFTGSWVNTDALHCRAMGVADRRMLYLDHIPLFTQSDNLSSYAVKARIVAHSGEALIADSLKVYYSTDDGATYDFVSMTPLVSPDSFVAYIPAQGYGTEVAYFLRAGDLSGRVENHPYIGAPMAHKFQVNMTPQINSPDSFICKTEGSFGYFPDIYDIDDTEHSIEYSAYPAWLNPAHDSLTGTASATPGLATFTVEVSDPYATGSQTVKILLYLCGDVDRDGLFNLLDIIYLIDYKFKNGPAPILPEAGDVDNSGVVDILDIVHMIDFKYKGGPAPNCP